MMNGQMCGEWVGGRVSLFHPCQQHAIFLGVRPISPTPPLLFVTQQLPGFSAPSVLTWGRRQQPLPGRSLGSNWHLAHSRCPPSSSSICQPHVSASDTDALPRSFRASSSERVAGPQSLPPPPGGSICSLAPGCYFCAACFFWERIFQQLWGPGMSQPCPVMARRRGQASEMS